MRSVELFGGAGGLALGVELAGFHPQAFVEWDHWACSTVLRNKALGYPLVENWPVSEGDVRSFDWTSIEAEIDLVTGGPPCQPFSMGGKGNAANDARDMFPAASEVIRTLRPKALLIENVRGLTRSSFASYYQLVLLRLQFPELVAKVGESWFEHLQRLKQESTSEHSTGLEYRIVPTIVNAADYGVPQQRHRVFIVGFRSDLQSDWSFPSPTHSLDALLYSQWVSGEYWERHKIATKDRPERPLRMEKKLRDLAQIDSLELALPWRTVRDALEGLPIPSDSPAKDVLNHVQQPGARSYPGHTGSPIDLPSKALKAGNHGVPGGENMLRNVDGTVRYFTIRESARLQTFPDRYELHGSWSEAMRQLGNAVPVLLANRVAGSIAEHLAEADVRRKILVNAMSRRSA